MWCCHCQQDVPAVAPSGQGRLACPRCGAYLDDAADFAGVYAHPADSGVSLDNIEIRPDLTPPINPLEREQAHRHLRRIGRQLRTGYRHEPSFGSTPRRTWGPEALASLDAAERLRQVKRSAAQNADEGAPSTIASRLVGLLLVVGVLGFTGGAGLLVWAAAFQLPQPWQWGLTTTIAAEGVLILGLTWMAARLWRNGRRMNRQLAGVDQQLHDIGHLAGSLAGSHLSSSQHYYDHFTQGASSHMLLANLRGQVEQLASRMSNS
jgi:hypothetical protein